MSIILPPNRLVGDESDMPLFFLAGPVRGGGNWQWQAYMELEKRIHTPFVVAIPVNYNIQHEAMTKVIGADRGGFHSTLEWERHFLSRASEPNRGCIIFWLPSEDPENPRPGRQYGRDTRGEIGEWRGRLMHDPGLSVVVGGQMNFDGFDVIQRNFHLALGTHFTIFRTLEDTVDAAIRKIL